MLVVLGLAVGLLSSDCAIDFDFGDGEVLGLYGSSVEEFSSAVGVFDIDADSVVVVDFVNEGISKGYWFQDGCVVFVKVLDTGFGD